MRSMHAHHFFNQNQLYLALETLLKTKNRVDDIELPNSSYPNFSSFVDSTVFNRKSNNSLSINWNIKSINAIVRRKEIIKPLKEIERVQSYQDLFDSFMDYLKSEEHVKDDELGQIPMSLVLQNTKEQSGKLGNIIQQYVRLFIDDELIGNGRDVSFTAHLEIFREYLDKVLHVFNPKYLRISPNDLMDQLKEKYVFVSEAETEYRFMEMVMTLWMARAIDIYDLEIIYKDNKYNYTATIALKVKTLTNDSIREKFKLSKSESVFVVPMDRLYIYENSQLIFRLTDGSTDQFDFSRAEKSRKMFEAFWELWKSDESGEYTIKRICEMYKKINKEVLEQTTKIGETVTNIRTTIIEPKHRIKDNIEWHYDRKNQTWIFRIVMRNKN